MRHALILPVSALSKFGQSTLVDPGLPRLHLCLSHLTRPEFVLHSDYLAYYKDRRQHGDYIIMDNGADENEKGIGEDLATTLEAAIKVHAQEVVVPDVQEDAPETIKAGVEAFAWLRTNEGRIAYSLAGRPRLMVVPQGSDWRQWAACAMYLLQNARATMKVLEGPSIVVAVAKQYDLILSSPTWTEGRVGAVDWLQRQLVEHEEIHLLGYPRGSYDVPRIEQKFPGIVRSVDSAKPVVYAFNAMKVNPWDSVPEYPLRPENYFDMDLNAFGEECLEHNIHTFCNV